MLKNTWNNLKEHVLSYVLFAFMLVVIVLLFFSFIGMGYSMGHSVGYYNGALDYHHNNISVVKTEENTYIIVEN